jgi:Fe-S-cluster-containing dehydrogenase component
MSSLDRRLLFKVAAAGAATAVAGTAQARVRPTAPPDALGLLYDTTRCIGCKACVVACREANGTPAVRENAPGGIWDAPMDLDGSTKNVIKLYKSRDGLQRSYFKAQCMHCVDPACASACMLGAFKKREFGIVTYDVNYCIGCRYCEVACPYGVPKFEWSKAAPRMVKCELCNHRLAQGKIPACADVCPRQAVIYGKREDLLRQAKTRIAENPGKYIQKVYGEHDGGGTQCLYLSHVPFEQLGLPVLGEESTPTLQRSIQHAVYKGFAAPIALYGILGVVMFRNRKRGEKEQAGEGGAA